MEMHQLQYFVKVAELGSFTRAAEACFVSQPSLSQQIIKLEKELGRPLFERLGRTVRLTEAGQALKQIAEQVLQLVEEAKSRVADDPAGGQLVAAAPPTVAPYFFPELLTRFAQRYPQASVEVFEDVTAVVLRKCAEGEIDLAILPLPLHGEGSLHVETLFTEELFLVLPAGHRLEKAKRVTIHDIESEPFLLLGEAHCLTSDALTFCHRQHCQPVVTTHVSQLTTILELVALGHGVSLIPAMAKRHDSSPARVYRSLDGEKPSRRVGAVWHRHRFHPKVMHRFLDVLREHATALKE